VRPFAFKSIGEKVDSILGMFNAADFLDRSIGYHGFKKMLVDRGVSEEQASIQALGMSKKASLLVDTARPIKAFQPQPGLSGMAWRLSTQFKQVPIKIVEQYLQIASRARKDPAAAARMVAGVGLAVAGYEEGLRTFHVSPSQFTIEAGGAFGRVALNVARNLAKDNVQKALEDTAL